MKKRASHSTIRTLVRLAGCLRPYPLQLTVGLVTFAAAGAIIVIMGQGVRRLLDLGMHGTPAALDQATIVLLVLVFAYGLAGFGRAYLSGFIAERVTADLRSQVFQNLLHQGSSFFETQGTGLLWSRSTADLSLIASMLASLVSALRSTVIVAGGLWAMLATSFSLTLVVGVLATLITASLLLFWRQIGPLSDEAQELTARSNSFALEAIGGVRVIQAFGQERRWSDRFVFLSEEAFRKADRRNLIAGGTVGLGTWMIFGSAVGLAWFVGRKLVAGQMTEGQASAFLFYALAVAFSGASLTELWGQLQRGIGGAQRLFTLIDARAEISAPTSPTLLNHHRSIKLSFSDVSFRYPARPESAALEGFCWDFAPGEMTAIVGPSGAGKSTIFQLLLRFYDPSDGIVRLGGVDIRLLDLETLRSTIGIVPQEPNLFSGTLEENIGFGRAGASEREIRAAAEAANALSFIEALPRGLKTEVGPQGAQLSGGQRQRIAIARAILRDPQVLLLDEATNALDASSEALIQDALSDFTLGRTTIVIAHRLVTVRSARTILVLDGGRLIASGSHAELLAEDGLYARFAALQLA